MADLERGGHFLFRRSDGLFLFLDRQLAQLILHDLVTLNHTGCVKALGTYRKIRRIERKRSVYLEPRDAERHHHIGHCVRFGEHVFDLFARVNVPVGHVLFAHRAFHFLGQALALTHGLHRLKRQLGLHALQNQIVHDIVTAADTAGQRNPLADQLGRIAQPYVRTVRQAGNRNQLGKGRGMRLLDHAAHELCTKLRHRQTAEIAQNGVGVRVFARVLQRLARMEQAHRVRVVKRNLLCVDAGQVFQMLNHGRIIVSQLVELQKVRVDRVIFKMGGDDIRIRVICGMLHRTDIVNLDFLGHDNYAAGMLPRCAAHARAARRKAVFLGARALDAALIHILFDVTVRGFFRDRADRACAEHMVVPENLACIPVNARLIFTREIQVDIRHFIALETEKRLERDVKSLFGQRFSAIRTDFIRQIDAAGVFLVPLDVFIIRAQIVRRKRVYLGDIRHKRRKRRADRTTRTNQIAVCERLGHQLLRDDVHNRVAVADN